MSSMWWLLQSFRALASAYALNSSFTTPQGDAFVHGVLKGWHNAVERGPLKVHSAFARLLRLLIRSDLVDLTVACPIVDAVHYRNSFALHQLLSAALPDDIGLPEPEVAGLDVDTRWAEPPPLRRRRDAAAAVEACLTERDRYGQTVLHAAVKSKAAGFARLFVRLGKLARDKGGDASEYVPIECPWCVSVSCSLKRSRLSA